MRTETGSMNEVSKLKLCLKFITQKFMMNTGIKNKYPALN